MIEADVPGVSKDDVNIELVSNELTITGEIKERERATPPGSGTTSPALTRHRWA